MRVGIVRPEHPTLLHPAVLSVKARHESIRAVDDVERSVVKIEAVRNVHADLHHTADAQVVFRIHLRQETQTGRDRPQLVGLPVVVGAVLAPPRSAIALDLLALHVELHDLAVVPVERAFELPQARRGARAIAADPDETAAHGEAARIVRFTDEVFENLSRFPVEQVDPFRHLIANPQAFR